MMRPYPGLLIVLAALANGCSSESSIAKDGVEDTDNSAELDPTATLRIDVRASEAVDADGERAPLPQSFGPVEANQPLLLELSDATRYAGALTADIVSPWRAAELPSVSDVVTGTLSVRRPYTAQSYNTTLDADGGFALQVVPGDGYVLSVSPDDPAIPPFSDFIDIAPRTPTQALHLEAGVPVWGTITDSRGATLPNVRVRVVLADGTRGGVALSDPTGRYLVRAPVGDVRIESLGRDNGRDPSFITAPVAVDVAGANVDLRVGDLSLHSLSGRVISQNGAPVSSATVRLTPTTLAGYEDVTLTSAIVLATTSTGIFDTQAPAGTYRVELLAPAGSTHTSVALPELVVSGPTALGDIALPSFELAQLYVTDAGDMPVADARITCVEPDLGQRSWTTFTDTQGEALLPLPMSPLRCTTTPPGDRDDLALTVHAVALAEDVAPTLKFASGATVFGTVVTPQGPASYAVVEVRDGAGTLWAAGISDEAGEFSMQLAWPQ